MSLTTTQSVVQYTPSGSNAYPIPFLFLDNSHIVATITDANGVTTTLALTTDYTLTGVGVPAGGTLITVVAYDNTKKLTIKRVVPQNQLTTFNPNDAFPAKAQESALDKLTMLIQQLQEQLNRCVVGNDGFVLTYGGEPPGALQVIDQSTGLPVYIKVINGQIITDTV